MSKHLYGLDDASWAVIEPLLSRGARRVDDRRVISGIMHMLKAGVRWHDCPADYGPYTTIYNRFNRWSKQGVWEDIFYALTGSSGVIGGVTGSIDSMHIKAHRSAVGAKGGALAQAIGRSRGGRTTKVHALTDMLGRPRAVVLTPSNAHDLSGARNLLAITGAPRRLLADRAYDARSLRDWLAERGCEPVIPTNPTRRNPHAYDQAAYKQRNSIERCFCRLKDFRRIHTRYDKRADIFLSAVLIVAAIIWWAN